MVGSASRRWISPRRSEFQSRTAIDTAVRFLAQRPRSAYEVQQRLRRAGLDAAAIDAVLDGLRRHGLVDDRAFAEYWVEQRQTFRPRGARLIRAELARLGVARQEAEDATTPLAASATEDAYRAASRYARRLSAADRSTFERRVGQWLLRRGFQWETVTTVVNRLASEYLSTS
jgi:regulatory protein